MFVGIKITAVGAPSDFVASVFGCHCIMPIFVALCFLMHVFTCLCVSSVGREGFGVVLLPRRTFYQRVKCLARDGRMRRKILCCVNRFVWCRSADSSGTVKDAERIFCPVVGIESVGRRSVSDAGSFWLLGLKWITQGFSSSS